ncbi:hypothetical protein LCGC14_3116670, partial [marine sediment metagenome]
TRKLHYKEGEADALNNTSSILMRKGEFQIAKEKLSEAEIITKSLNDSLRLSIIYGNYGMLFGMQGKYDSSVTYFKNAIAIAETSKHATNLGSLYNGLAIGYQMKSNYQEALSYQQKSLRIAEKQNNISAQASTTLNMGNTYQRLEDTLRAEKTLLKAVELALQAGAKNVEIYSYSNLASLYQDLGEWEKDYDYAIQAAKLAKELGDTAIEAASYSKAGIALSNLERYEEAKTLIQKGMVIATTEKQPIIISQLNEAMGRTLVLQQKYKEAIPYFENCLEATQDTDQYDGNVAFINEQLAKCYEIIGNYENALIKFKKYAAIKDSIRAKENIQKATEQTMTYE